MKKQILVALTAMSTTILICTPIDYDTVKNDSQEHFNKQDIIKDLLAAFKDGKVDNNKLHTCIKTNVLANANLDIQDESGNTLLHYAAEQGNDKLVKMLISSGANTDIRNDRGETAHAIIERKMLATTAYSNDNKLFKKYNNCLTCYRKITKRIEKKSVATAIDVFAE